MKVRGNSNWVFLNFRSVLEFQKKVYCNNFSSAFLFSATFEEELMEIRNDISCFHQQLTELVNEISSEHDEEKVRLSILKGAYASKVKRLGIYEAERMAAMKNKYGYITSKV